MAQTSYSEARQHLAALLDRVTQDREKVIIKRRGHPDVALIAADELASMEETHHLFRSPENARRLFDAIAGARRGEGVVVSDEALTILKREVARGATWDEAMASAGLPATPTEQERADRA